MTVPPETLLDGLSRLRAENDRAFGPSPVMEIASRDYPDDQAVSPEHQRWPTPGSLARVAQSFNASVGSEVLPSGTSPDDPDVQAALEGLYGSQFPLLNGTAQAEDWVKWAESLWTAFGPGMYANLHLVERNRLFYQGNQWVSAIGFGPWREPAKPRDVVRTVRNYIKPALDMRTQLLAEQRPGFNCTPASGDPHAAQRAEADQVALEWSWHEQGMTQVAREAGRRVGTDGVTFLELYWDPDEGPWYEVPRWVNPEVAEFPLGKKPGQKFPLGDVRTKVRSIEQVRVSPDATASHRPMIWVVREVISRVQAIQEHGAQVANEGGRGETDDDMQHITASRNGFILPRPDELLHDHQVTVRLIVYCDKSEYLPKGLTMAAVGAELVVPPVPLPCGRVPIVRWTDGSTDPSFYPLANMQDWIDAQQRINSILSKWYEAIRKGANTNFLGRGGVLKGETLIGGTLNFYEVAAPSGVPLSDIIQPIGPFDISQGALAALQQEVKAIEDLTGYNDATRGSFTADQSGRAILAVREQVERVFAPFVNAAAEAMCDWGEIGLAFMKAYYDLPRMIAIEGADRPDLARLLSADDLDVAAQVWIDPETLMPMPRSLKLAVLDDMLQKQLISPQEYRRRMPFAMVRSLESPDSDQSARAHRIAEAIRRTGTDAQYPILWQDDEAQNQDVLERLIIFDDSLSQAVRSVANERWMRLAQQAQMKQQGMALPPGEPHPQGAPQPPQGAALPGQTTSNGLMGPARIMGPGQAPVGPMSPVASQPMTQIGLPDQLQAASRWERTQPQ